MAEQSSYQVTPKVGMNHYNPQDQSRKIPSSDIVDLCPVVTGILITFVCVQCRRPFQAYQPTVAGLAFGKHACPECKMINELWPEDFLAAIEQFFPHCNFEELSFIKNEGSRIARTWYRDSPMTEVLMYKGVNLGEPTERVLLSYVLTGLYKAYLANQEKK